MIILKKNKTFIIKKCTIEKIKSVNEELDKVKILALIFLKISKYFKY